jgi:hypothetical protein
MSEKSNVVPFKIPKAFAHLDPNESSLGGGIVGGFSSIGYRAKVLTLRHRGETYHFTREDDNTPSHHIDVIIVGVNPNVSKTYYAEWTEDSSGAPLCTSVNGTLRGPDPGVPVPQARSCTVCPRDEWKTLSNGKRGKECQDNKRLAVILMPKVSARMLGAPLKEPVFLKVPPGSLTNLRTYHESLQHQGLHHAIVITRVSFDQDQLFRLKFELAQVLTDAEAPFILSKLENADPLTKRIIGTSPEIQEIDAPAVPMRQVDTAGLKETFGDADEEDEGHPDLISGVMPPKGAARLKEEAAAQRQAAAPAPRKAPGRPKKEVAAPAAPAAKTTKPAGPLFDGFDGDNGKAAPQRAKRTAPAPAPAEEAEVVAPSASWEDASSELSEEVDNLLGGKLDKMM